jgi:hypothetical protein
MMPTDHRLGRGSLRVLLATTALLAVVASGAAARPVRPDLVVRAISDPPASVQAGKGFVKLKPEACLAFACTNFDNVKLKGNPASPVIPKFKPEIGLSAKAGVKGCSQVLW